MRASKLVGLIFLLAAWPDPLSAGAHRTKLREEAAVLLLALLPAVSMAEEHGIVVRWSPEADDAFPASKYMNFRAYDKEDEQAEVGRYAVERATGRIWDKANQVSEATTTEIRGIQNLYRTMSGGEGYALTDAEAAALVYLMPHCHDIRCEGMDVGLQVERSTESEVVFWVVNNVITGTGSNTVGFYRVDRATGTITNSTTGTVVEEAGHLARVVRLLRARDVLQQGDSTREGRIEPRTGPAVSHAPPGRTLRSPASRLTPMAMGYPRLRR